MKTLLTLTALLLSACLFEPETKTTIIHCGDLDLRDTSYGDPQPDTFTVVDGACNKIN